MSQVKVQIKMPATTASDAQTHQKETRKQLMRTHLTVHFFVARV